MSVLIPLPDRDFDVTEVAVPWHLLTKAGYSVVFATEEGGSAPECDPLLLTGVIFGKLGAESEAKQHYRNMIETPEFKQPVSWKTCDMSAFDGLLLSGGHAKGMRQYLGSAELQQQIVRFWKLSRPIGAICHGTLVLARSVDSETGASVLAGRKTTCLPKYMERAAYLATFWKLGTYYRTYDEYVEDEVVRLMGTREGFQVGPVSLGKKPVDSPRDAFIVKDGHYVSGRWPGDAWEYGREFVRMLAEHKAAAQTKSDS